jgi:lipoprotein-releasing system permease protein
LLRQLPGFKDTISEEQITELEQGGGVAIGRDLADYLSLTVGSTIQIFTAPDGFGRDVFTPSVGNHPVRAIFETGVADIDSAAIYLPLATAQSFLQTDAKVQKIELFLEHPDNLEEPLHHVESIGGSGLSYRTWMEQDRAIFSALNVERNVMFIILSLIILVSSLNIISGLSMLVRSKHKNIAILRTFGATRGAILRIFLMLGMSIGAVATLVGAGIGVFLASNIVYIRQVANWIAITFTGSPELAFFSELPSRLDYGEVAAVVALSFLISLSVPVWPAWQAANVDPAKGVKS